MAVRRNGQSIHHPRPDEVEQYETLCLVWELRAKMWTQQQIADEIGVSQPTVSKYIKQAKKEFAPESAKTYRSLVIMVCEDMIRRAYEALEAGDDISSIAPKVVYPGVDRLMELLGLKGVQKYKDMTGEPDDKDVKEVAKLIKRARKSRPGGDGLV